MSLKFRMLMIKLIVLSQLIVCDPYAQKYSDVKLPPRRQKNLLDLDRFLKRLAFTDEEEITVEEVPSPLINPIIQSSHSCITNAKQCKADEKCRMILTEEGRSSGTREICVQHNRELMHPSIEGTIFITDHPRFPTIALKVNEDLSIKNFGVIHSEGILDKHTMDSICKKNGDLEVEDVSLDNTMDYHCRIPLTYHTKNNKLYEQLPVERWNKDKILKIKCKKNKSQKPTAPWSSWSPWTTCKNNVASVRWRICLGEPGESCGKYPARNQLQAAKCYPFGRKRVCGLKRSIPTIKVITSQALIPNRSAEKAAQKIYPINTKGYTKNTTTSETTTTLGKNAKRTTMTTTIESWRNTTTAKIPISIREDNTMKNSLIMRTENPQINQNQTSPTQTIEETYTDVATTSRENSTNNNENTTIRNTFKEWNGMKRNETWDKNENSIDFQKSNSEITTKPIGTTSESEIIGTTTENKKLNSTTTMKPVETTTKLETKVTTTTRSQETNLITTMRSIETTTDLAIMRSTPENQKSNLKTTIKPVGIKSKKRIQLIQAVNPMNYAETMQWCKIYNSRLLQMNEVQFQKVNNQESQKQWFFINAQKINQTWVWRDSFQQIKLPQRKTNQLINYNEDKAEKCLASNTRKIVEIPCLIQIRPICIKDQKIHNSTDTVIEQYYNLHLILV